MRVRNIVRGGTVIALGLGLASLDTGIGLTANESTGTHAQPGYTVGPGGGGAFYYSGPATLGPSNLHLCTENSYDLGRYGPVSFCSSDVPLVKEILEAGGACLIGAVGAYLNTQDGDVSVSGKTYANGCAVAGTITGWTLLIAGAATPVHAIHPGGYVETP